MDKKIVLHVGCGTVFLSAELFNSQEWQEVRLDIDPAVSPDIVSSITDMNTVQNRSVDVVWSAHNLEHLYADEVNKALHEFYRVLKPNGMVMITLPDIQAVTREAAKGRLEEPLFQSHAGPIAAIDILWGHRASIERGNHHMAHKTGFTLKTLEKKIASANFKNIEVKSIDWDLWATAYKLRSNGRNSKNAHK
jgi:predicted SAM-dependent methyltransferase